ncbi:TetR/AcrR family transcriptional regulator [Fructilactobacillus sp. Tb1]|uniref:TetR/AcrR family transcriptional regulator n=1 Tax=Fructilactobacillus sp. Tb1 TaxID=3422304 RepID=UPI003D297692
MVQRTNSKDSIAMALFDEIIDTHISEVTITALINRSKIARRTFYNNFDNIYEVIVYLIDLIDEKLDTPNLDEGINGRAVTASDVLDYLPEHIYENRDLLRVIYTTDLRGFWFNHVMEKYEKWMIKYLFSDYRSKVITKEVACNVLLQTVIAAVDSWISKPVPDEPDQFRAVLLEILQVSPIGDLELSYEEK